MSTPEYQAMLAAQMASVLSQRKTKDDVRTKNEKKIIAQREKKQNRFSKLFSSERTRVIKEKIAHYEATGNKRKLAIYRSKL